MWLDLELRALLKRLFFRSHLKVSREVSLRISAGRVFQRVGAVAQKAGVRDGDLVGACLLVINRFIGRPILMFFT